MGGPVAALARTVGNVGGQIVAERPIYSLYATIT